MSTEKVQIEAVEEPAVKILGSEPTSDVMEAPSSTIYAAIMASMTPEKLADLGVKLIYVNNSDLFWVTSVGQLYPFSNRAQAVEAEYTWLLSNPTH